MDSYQTNFVALSQFNNTKHHTISLFKQNDPCPRLVFLSYIPVESQITF